MQNVVESTLKYLRETALNPFANADETVHGKTTKAGNHPHEKLFFNPMITEYEITIKNGTTITHTSLLVASKTSWYSQNAKSAKNGNSYIVFRKENMQLLTMVLTNVPIKLFFARLDILAYITSPSGKQQSEIKNGNINKPTINT